MTVIWKYPLASKWVENVDVCMVRPVHVGLDPQGRASVWIEVDPDGDATNCTVTIVATGETIPEDAGQYVGSFVDGAFVWHVYLSISPVGVDQ